MSDAHFRRNFISINFPVVPDTLMSTF